VFIVNHTRLRYLRNLDIYDDRKITEDNNNPYPYLSGLFVHSFAPPGLNGSGRHLGMEDEVHPNFPFSAISYDKTPDI